MTNSKISLADVMLPVAAPPAQWATLPLMPPKLAARMKQYDFEPPPFSAVFDRLLVYPLDKFDQIDMTTAGVALAPETKARMAAQRGVVVSVGVKAAQELFAHGIGLGDIVIMARFSQWPRAYPDSKGHPHVVYIIQAGEIVASEDLKRDYDSGDLHIEIETETGETRIAERERHDPPIRNVGEGV